MSSTGRTYTRFTPQEQAAITLMPSRGTWLWML
jgi:hypothetical protein